jgi:tetratricopeptide (TPR) repeat protein
MQQSFVVKVSQRIFLTERLIIFVRIQPMKKILNLTLIILLITSCNSSAEKIPEEKTADIAETRTPKEMLKEAYQLFKEGDDSGSIALANRVLAIGKATQNDTLVGRALTSLCRNAQRKLDTTRLGALSDELAALSASTGDSSWLMYRAHMNAEMWRLIGQMDRAEGFYTESMQISKEIGAMGMYTIDHFNKSFVSTAKGDFNEANTLISRYYQLRKEANKQPDDAYGLIALAYLLEQQKQYAAAHEVAVVTRRLFKEQNLFPEPPDEQPLLLVEQKVHQMLTTEELKRIRTNAATTSVTDLLQRYLK